MTLCDQGSLLISAGLGILKAGLFYTPLDPQSAPDAALKLLKRLNPEAIIIESSSLKSFGELDNFKIPIICLDTLDGGLSVDNPTIPIEPTSLAYVYFTSGSTGAPKGVMDTHRNLLHNVMRYTNSLGISSSDRLSLLHAPNLSACLSSQFGALLNGASVFPKRIQSSDVAELPDWLLDKGITIYHSVPELFRFALNRKSRHSKLRWIRLEGDPSWPEDLATYQELAPPACRLVNGLGTTETGIFHQFFFDKASTLPKHPVSVGHPVEDMKVYTIGADGNLQTEGPGEIVVSSPYISPGYWNDPNKTLEHFIPNPEKLDQRIWRSRDLGNLNHDGCLEYLGRMPDKSEINDNGRSTPKNKPHSQIEKSLASYWEDLFPGSEIYLESNLIELGGTSLTAIRLINKIEKDYSLRLTQKEIVENPTLAGLVKCLEKSLEETTGEPDGPDDR
ncbi:non-ribosomal peptide synthetase [Opitutia bacterium ISCC 51]|nr:non-ribosomal peptide synthetase [Opitutae bacterium ISCC 51]QXD28948.1 non-ribosomal peptide synthetase [Opitutae bacterium ISCC 52]